MPNDYNSSYSLSLATSSDDASTSPKPSFLLCIIADSIDLSTKLDHLESCLSGRRELISALLAPPMFLHRHRSN